MNNPLNYDFDPNNPATWNNKLNGPKDKSFMEMLKDTNPTLKKYKKDMDKYKGLDKE